MERTNIKGLRPPEVAGPPPQEDAGLPPPADAALQPPEDAGLRLGLPEELFAGLQPPELAGHRPLQDVVLPLRPPPEESKPYVPVKHRRQRFTVEDKVRYILAYEESKDKISQAQFLESLLPAVIKPQTFSDWLKDRNNLFIKMGTPRIPIVGGGKKKRAQKYATHVLPRKRHRFTVEDKVSYIQAFDEIKDEVSQAQFLESLGPAVIKPQTFSDWLKDRDRLFEKLDTRELAVGKKKCVYIDHLSHIKKGLVAFYDMNQAKEENCRIPITGAVLSAEAKVLRNEILLRDEANEITLTDDEREKMKVFTASETWSRKFARAQGWINGGTHKKKVVEEVDEETQMRNELDAVRQIISDCQYCSHKYHGYQSQK